MMDLFEAKTAVPMRIGSESEPFDDPEWVYELKLDGERCLAYLDKSSTVLINRSVSMVLPKFPELAGLHHQAHERCILDGELIITVNGKPDFEEIKRRWLLKRQPAIEMAAQRLKATFVAYDILYQGRKALIDLPLMERKELLSKTVKENDRLALSRFVENDGKAFFDIVRQQGLEGIVAKRRDSRYYPGKTTADWVKIKNLLDDDFVICGYIAKSPNIASLVLGQYKIGREAGDKDSRIIQLSRELAYKGRVAIGQSNADFKSITARAKAAGHPFAQKPPADNKDAVWIVPELVCKVRFISRTPGGALRQPVYVGLRPDKSAAEAVEYQWKKHSD